MAYCTHDEVGTLLQLKFDTTTSNPTSTKVAGIIDLVSSEVNMVLLSAGIALPTAGTDLYNVVKLKVMQGSAGIIGFTGYGNTEDVNGSQADYYRKEYMLFLKQLKEDPGAFLATTNEIYISNQISAGFETEKSVTEILIGNDWEA